MVDGVGVDVVVLADDVVDVAVAAMTSCFMAAPMIACICCIHACGGMVCACGGSDSYMRSNGVSCTVPIDFFPNISHSHLVASGDEDDLYVGEKSVSVMGGEVSPTVSAGELVGMMM